MYLSRGFLLSTTDISRSGGTISQVTRLGERAMTFPSLAEGILAIRKNGFSLTEGTRIQFPFYNFFNKSHIAVYTDLGPKIHKQKHS